MQRQLWLAVAMAILAARTAGAERQVSMQQMIERAAEAAGGIVGVSATNLLTGEEVGVNADVRFPTASTIKTAVMVEVYHQAAEGKLSLDERIPLRAADKVGGSGVLNGLGDGITLSVRDLVHLMIVLSDNTATNLLVARVTAKAVDDRMLTYGLKETRIFRPTFRDGKPDVFPELEREFGLGMTTPREMARLMALIAGGKAVSADASAAMLATLRRQQDRAMIPRLLPAESSLEIGNKTGTDAEKLPDDSGRRGAIRADAAIVTGKGVKYVVAIYARRGTDRSYGVDNASVLAGARISRIIFDRFAGK
jgi:beta-lactamase class A